MRRFSVGYSSTAEDDLRAIADWITDAEGTVVALGYVARIRAFCAQFDTFPQRGTRLRGGVRRIGFERRCAILQRRRREREHTARPLRRPARA